MSTLKWKMGVEKLYESEDFLIVNKPFDMYINSDDENEKNTVTYHIASPDSHLSSSANPIHFIQRLDYSTSGVLCIAKNKIAAARAGKLFEKRRTRKYYLAVVRGHVNFEVADIEFEVGECNVISNGMDPLTADSSHRMSALINSSSSSSCVQSRGAQTRILVLETGRYDDEPVTVVLLKPITDMDSYVCDALEINWEVVSSLQNYGIISIITTSGIWITSNEKFTDIGRRHQLRVHCKAVGHIILGDYTYSNAIDITPHRMFLHATRLVLPLVHEQIDVQTSEPFFSDPQFASKWKPDKVFYKYRTKEDFRQVCGILDESYVVGVKYKVYRYSEIV